MNAVAARIKTALRSALTMFWGWVKPAPESWKGAGNAALALGLLVFAA